MDLLKASAKGYFLRVKQLVRPRRSVDVSSSQGGTGLTRATTHGSMDEMGIIYECGEDEKSRDDDRCMSIIDAANDGHWDVVRVLVIRGVAVDDRDDEGRTALVLAARDGHLDVVRFLVKNGADVDARDGNDRTPLIWAAGRCRLDVIRYLVECGAIVDARDGNDRTALVLAASDSNWKAVRFLVRHGASVDARDNHGRTPLMLATCYNHLDMVKFLVKHEASVDAYDNGGCTALFLAASDGRLDMVHFFVGRKADVDARDSYDRTPLMIASRGGHLDVVHFLVKHRAFVNARDCYGQTPLMLASCDDRLDIVCFLVMYGAVVNDCDSNGRTPLILATSAISLNVAHYFVRQGLHVDAPDSNGRTPLEIAAESGRLDVVRFLVYHGAIVDAHFGVSQTPLMRAAENCHTEVVRFLVEHGAAVNVCDGVGRTALVLAAHGSHWDTVRILVESGADVDTRAYEGRTTLMLAAIDNQLDMVRFLVKRGAVVDARDDVGRTALVLATRGGNWDVVRILVERDAAVDARDSDGRTPLVRVAEEAQWEIVRLLVEHGAAVEAYDSFGRTPLIFAADHGNLDVVRFLVKHGAKVDARSSRGRTPLMLAASGGHLEVVRFLVKHGADVDACTLHGRTPLMLATCSGYLDVVHFFVKHGAFVDARDLDDRSVLIWATRGGHWDVVQYLVESGATVNAHDSYHRTPLMLAARDGRLNVVRFLVEHEAFVNARDGNDWTPLIWAAGGAHWNVVRFLVENGAIVDVCDSDGRSSLILASRAGQLDIVRFLVEYGANSNLIATDGNTAISSATEFGRQDVVQFLLGLVQFQVQKPKIEHLDENVEQFLIIPTSWIIAPFEIEVEPFVAAGNIGGDYRGKWLDTDVVVKLFVGGATSTSFTDEVRLWHQLRHPNVLKLYGVCNTDHKLFVCEYASNGTLPDYLKSCGDEHRTPWKFLHDAALGLEYLHVRKTVHGNLRGSNILIGTDGMAKLSMFGLSAPPAEGRWINSGELVRWVAPEVLIGKQVSFASDVYSFGMCIIEAVSGNVPYSMESERNVESAKKRYIDLTNYRHCNEVFSTDAQRQLVLTMCRRNPRKRLQMPTVVNKLQRFAEMESAKLTQLTGQTKPDQFISFNAFDNGRTSSLWNQVQYLVAQGENVLYRQMWYDLKLIFDALKSDSQSLSTLQRFRGLLNEFRLVLDTISQQNRICRLSATRARDYSIQGLHRRISQLLQLVYPQDQDAETRETEWKRLCREQVEMFISEASEACVMLSSVDSEEDRSALVAVLRAELRSSDGKYTDKQLEVLQKAHDDIVSKSLEDVHHATTPEWFIPWFELEMNEMMTLGEGGFASVFKAKWLDSEVVVKKLEISPKDAANADKKREMRQMFEREVDIWFGLSHPHVVRLFGACHVGRPFFVCELAPNGTLVEYLRRHPDELWSKLREAALGVQYLHARGIVHGDLKGNNIMIGSDVKAKVTDFGLSGVFGDDSTDFVVTGAWHWAAPECILGQKPTFSSDIYSLGMCIIEALRVTNGDEYTLPWGKLPNPAVKFHVTKRHTLPQRSKNCSNEAWTLIEHMCKSAPTDRTLIITVVDELEKLAGRHWDLSGGVDQIVNNIDKMQLSSSSVVDTIAEMKTWLANCDTKSDWENNVLKKIHKLLWDRLEHVTTQLGEITSTSGFAAVVESSRVRTQAALGITSDISLVKFTELALGGYALHRRLDKFMAAHAVATDSKPLHDWKTACSLFMEASAGPTQTKLASATEVASAS